MAKTTNIPVNVNVSAAGRQRILSEEAFWDGPKLVILALVTLAIACVALWFMANSTIPSPSPNYMLPWEGAKLR